MALATKALATEDGQSAQTTQLQAISTAIGNIGLNNIGNLATLTTTDKTSLVGAVNEVNAGLATKADKDTDAVLNDIAIFDSTGNPVDGNFSFDKDGQTATGNPLSFTTDSAQVASDCKITLEPLQVGGGDPSPSNVRAISGRDSLKIVNCGKNILREVYIGGIDNETGQSTTGNNAVTDYIGVIPNSSYTLSNLSTSQHDNFRVFFYDATKNFIETVQYSIGTDTFGTFTTGNNIAFIRLKAASAKLPQDGSAQLELGSTSTAYEPYNPVTDITLNLPETVYGGVLDVEKGELVVDRAMITPTSVYGVAQADNVYYWVVVNNATSINGANVVSSHFKSSNILAAGNCYMVYYGQQLIVAPFDQTLNTKALADAWMVANKPQFVYKLATPYTIHLTPAQVNLLKGANTVTTNGTTITLKYRDGELAKLEDLSGIGESINKLGEISGELVNGTDAILNVYGSKNLLPNNAVSQTINGVTFTVNADGSVTVNGTASADADIVLSDSYSWIENGRNYVMTGCPSNGSNSSYRLYVNFFYNSIHHVYNDYGNGVTCRWDDIPDSGSKIFSTMIKIKSGYTVNNLTFYPMIRDARIKDATYVPYAMTNRELTEEMTSLKPTVGKSIKAITNAWTGTTLTFANITASNIVMYRFTALRNDGRYCEYIFINRVDGIISVKIAGNIDCSFTINDTTLTATFGSEGYYCYQLVKLNNYY